MDVNLTTYLRSGDLDTKNSAIVMKLLTDLNQKDSKCLAS
jgi:ABC-type lipoprotein export system ATPase subunit